MELIAEGLNVGHDASRIVQRGVSLTLAAGQVCCVLGPNGCGKSTLFSTLLGLLPARSGHVWLQPDDPSAPRRDVSSMEPIERAAHLAYVPQRIRMPFPYPVRDVVEMGLTARLGASGAPAGDDARLVDATMHEMGVWDLRDEPVTQLSGGELQLVLIARALVQQPAFVLMDEPTAALDYGNEVRVIEQVRALAGRGVGVLMTTHNPDHVFLLDADVLLLGKDVPARSGRCWDVLTDEAMRAAYKTEVYRVQFETSKGANMYVCVPDLGE